MNRPPLPLVRIAGVLLLLPLALALGPAPALAVITMITPQQGKVGQPAVVHGSGLSGGPIIIRFGRRGSAPAGDLRVVSDRTATFTVPDTPADDRNPGRPNVVPVTATHAGVTRHFTFEYDPPGPQPMIERVDPAFAESGIPFTVAFTGTNFTTRQGRAPKPDDAFLLATPAVRGMVDTASVRATGFEVMFPTVATPGIYDLIVGFTDGAAAATGAFTVTGPNVIYVDERTGGTLTLPEIPGFAITVLPGSAAFPDGSAAGGLMLQGAQIVRPSPLEVGLLLDLHPSEVRFDPPAPVTVPNLDGLAPGTSVDMFSFDHDLASFVSIGTGTVSEDGAVIVSDPGFGITKGG